MMYYDFCIAWNWEYDADFVALLSKKCKLNNISILQITADSLMDIISSLENNRISFKVFYDRASDTDMRFMPVVEWAVDHTIYYINHHNKTLLTRDKSRMHYALINAGLYTPYTIMIPPYDEHPELPIIDLSPLGDHFILKPAHGGGSEGVVLKVTSLSQIKEARQLFPDDTYLLQTHITPIKLRSQPAWFRVLYCREHIYICWWDTQSHIYTPLTVEDEDLYTLFPIRSIMRTLAELCGLDVFSTEIALTPERRFVVVDYVNDPIDFRFQSKAIDGVPDEIIEDIAQRHIEIVKSWCAQQIQLPPTSDMY